MAESDSVFLLRKLFQHDGWANRTVVESLDSASAPPVQAVRLMAHIIGAEWLWLARLEGTTANMAVWPGLSAAECGAELPKLEQAWREYLDRPDMSKTIAYTNSRGEHFESTVLDILTHVPMHSHYHRGQIATLMRQAALEPAYTDFIHYKRTVEKH